MSKATTSSNGATSSTPKAPKAPRGLLASPYNPARPTPGVLAALPANPSKRLPKGARLACMQALREAGMVYGAGKVYVLQPKQHAAMLATVRETLPNALRDHVAWCATALHRGLYPALVAQWREQAAQATPSK